MRRLVFSLLAIALGLLGGFLSARVVLQNGELLGRTEHDHWFGNRNAGYSGAGPYARGVAAAVSLLALDRSETIYFLRYKDESGRPLREGCVYQLAGGDLPARWWSITAYAKDDFLPVNGADAHSIDMTQVRRNPEGRWTARLARDRSGAANWIATENAGDFNLVLRMYNPEQTAREDESTIPYPTITTLACGGPV